MIFENRMRPIGRFEVKDTEELLALPEFEWWRTMCKAENEKYGLGQFHRFSISKLRHDQNADLVICEINEGKKWYVIGYLHHPFEADLPDFQNPS
jgi:hypothetical protein